MSNIVKWPSSQNWSQPQCWPPNCPPGPGVPGCTCGCQPCQCSGGWGSGAMDCWQQISQYQQFLMCMLSQMGPIPLQGVTDGSDAKAGNIGEFMTGSAVVAYAVYPANTIGNAAVMVLPPGDWDLWAYLDFSGPIGGAQYYLSPVPTGVSNNMMAVLGPLTTGAHSIARIVGPYARGSFTVPTLLPFYVNVNQSFDASLLAGSATMSVEARRRR